MSKGVLIREGNHDVPEIIDVPEDICECAKIIDADLCNIVIRYIDDVEYWIICDDCGLLKYRMPTAYGDDVLVGSIIFTKVQDPGGYLECFVDLTNEEIEKINSKITRRPQGIMIRDVMHHSNMIDGIDYELWDAAATVNRDACEYLHVMFLLGAMTCENVREELLHIVGVN